MYPCPDETFDVFLRSGVSKKSRDCEKAYAILAGYLQFAIWYLVIPSRQPIIFKRVL